MKIALVCSHGGHLTEMLAMVEAFAGADLFFVTYEGLRADELKESYRTYTLRNIGTSVWRMAASFPLALRILLRERPAAVVSTGSEIAIPFFFLARLMGIRSVFVESFCRIRTASATGRLLYPIADTFLVQWPQLLPVYGPKARYEGGLL